MFYVYLLRAINFPDKTYVGFAHDIEERLKKHNEGGSRYTRDYKPWKLVTIIGFEEESKARSFEKYLKAGSGYSFARKRFW